MPCLRRLQFVFVSVQHSDELLNRGLHDADELGDRLEAGSITLYIGFDPTGPSLHVGHLVPVVLLYQGWTYWVFRKRVTG